MERNQNKKKGKSPVMKRSKSPRRSPSRSSPRRSPSPKNVRPRGRKVAPFPIIYNEPVQKSQLQQLYEETLKFMMNK